jgi:hypothetical protein
MDGERVFHAPTVTQQQRAEVTRVLPGPPFSSPFDPAHHAEVRSIRLSVDEDGKTNGAMVFDFVARPTFSRAG